MAISKIMKQLCLRLSMILAQMKFKDTLIGPILLAQLDQPKGFKAFLTDHPNASCCPVLIPDDQT